jgi:hypothetical protein
MANIMDSFKHINVTLRNGIKFRDLENIVALGCEIIQFDLIGMLIDFEDEVFFLYRGRMWFVLSRLY